MVLGGSAAVGIVLAAALSGAAGSSSAAQPPTVETVVATMSLKEKVGQLVMFLPNGPTLSSAERDLIDRHALGGVILFSKNSRDRAQLRALNDRIQKVARNATRYDIGALISVDQEGGVVKRFSDMPPWYSAPEMGARDVSVSYRQG
ncbi:MAG TPA: glycoside hydrolase family 3 N-terminal domain-containing protein, partial [Actinomycetota bacterium]|nr:glycoside hydrolase family 3 N-terminal domain-containing protein [Actinomycetota bacterium]